MPRVKIDYVVSFSSEDPDNPANNLLAREVSKKKWLCKTGESSSSVVLQLAKAVKISAVHIGAYNAATVEVLVGRSEKPDEPFQVLVPSSVFVSASEARRGALERVRSFSSAQLAAAAAQRWDRLRLVCAQPYNKHCKYGISFIHLDEPEDSADVSSSVTPSAVPPRLFTLESAASSSDEEEFRPGELFAKHLQHMGTETTSTESQIRQASSQALKNISDSASRITKSPMARQAPGARTGAGAAGADACAASVRAGAASVRAGAESAAGAADRRRDALLYVAEDARAHPRIDSLLQNHKRLRDDQTKQMHVQTTTNKQVAEKKNKAKMETKTHQHKQDEESQSISNRATLNNSSTSQDPSYDKRNNNRNIKHDINGSHNSSNKRDSVGNNRDSISKIPDSVGNKSDSVDKKRANTSNKQIEVIQTSRQPKDQSATDEERVGPRSTSPLRGVVFALSGYQNPERAELRDLGVRLGAHYERDWTPRCTHLVCAFPNTPKLKALRAGAGAGAGCVRAARGEWVRRCAARARLLPWRWFATEPQQRREPPPDRRDTSSERDTDDEIEDVLRNKKKQRRHSPEQETRRPNTSAATGDDDVNVDNADAVSELNDSDVMFVRDERFHGHVTVDDSDSDDTICDDEPKPAREEIDESKCLPKLFAGYTFALECAPRAALQRYVRAYGGLVVHGEADYVVRAAGTGGAAGAACAGGASARVGAVSARWVRACHRRGRLLPPDAEMT